MDTARGRTVWSESEPSVMPNLRNFGADGVVFEQARATSPWTLPSHASVFTGQYTSEHGTHAVSQQFEPDHESLVENFVEAGYTTAGFSTNPWVAPDLGFDDFEEFFHCWKPFDIGPAFAEEQRDLESQSWFPDLKRIVLSQRGPVNLLNALYLRIVGTSPRDAGAARTIRRFRKWLDESGGSDGPFLAYLNFMEPHLPYEPPRRYRFQFTDERWWERTRDVNQDAWAYMGGAVDMSDEEFAYLRRLYRAELRYLDDRLEELFDDLRGRGLLEDTVTIVVGDHGENIGEHGLMDHQYSLADTVLHVPLVIRYPTKFAEGERRMGLVELRDLYPTLHDVCDVDRPEAETISAHSLRTADGRDRVYAEYLATLTEIRDFDRALRSVETEEWKLIESSDGRHWLYKKALSPNETKDVSSEHPKRVAALKQSIERELGPLKYRGSAVGRPHDTLREQQLERLGYKQ